MDSVQLLFKIGSPHEALKDRETTCTCCSEDAEMQESVDSPRKKLGGAEWCEIEGLAARDSGLSWMRNARHRLLALQIELCISSCDYDRPIHLMQVILQLLQSLIIATLRYILS